MPSRELTLMERAYAAEVFRDSVDLGRVRITRGSALAAFSATAIGNTINLRPSDFDGATMDLSITGWTTLIHELAHVWQFQTRGIGYIPRSLLAQFVAFVTTGSRSKAYDWLTAARAGIPWEKWNPEQQAECIACYAQSLRRKSNRKSGKQLNPGGLTDNEIVTLATPYVENVRNTCVPR